VNGHSFSVSGPKFKKLVPSAAVNLGENRLQMFADSFKQLDIQELRIYPRRLRQWNKDYTPEISSLTPARFDFYFNPGLETKLELSFLFQKSVSFQANLTVTSEKNQISFPKTIKNGKTFQIPALDQSFHHIRIDIPELNTGLIQVEKNLLVRPGEKMPGFSDLKTRSKNKNVLLILLDAARADHLSCYGYERPTTPNIDKLAEKSYIFQNVYSEASYTLASTGTLLTGLPPDYHGVVSAFFNTLGQEIKTLPELLREKGYYTAAVSANPYFGSSYFYDQGFEDFTELFRQSGAVDANAFLEPFSRLAGRKNHKPFFIYLHIREPHHPYKMPPPFFGRYQQKYKKYSEKFKIEADSIYKGQTRNPEDFRFLSNIYDENLSYADHIVGKIIKSLEEKKQLENTIIIITADHGEALGEHGMVGHNMVLHREGIQIPLIIYFPCGKKTSVTQERPAITSDIVVTLCDLLDISYPYPHLTRGKNLFSLPDKRTRICRSLTMPSNYAGYMIESFPYRMIFFPHTGEERNPINRESIEDAFKSILFQFVKDSTKGIKSGNTPELSKKELENLRSLGYIK
jgi:arylsulfatase